MADIAEIMDMIDWHMPSEIRIKGVSLARDTETIIPFIQPLTPEHNKNVWEGCAAIIAEKSDENLKPYLVDLLGWLQDMNWPGAFCILNRLQRYADNDSIHDAINICIEKQRSAGMRFGKATCDCFCINGKINSEEQKSMPKFYRKFNARVDGL